MECFCFTFFYIIFEPENNIGGGAGGTACPKNKQGLYSGLDISCRSEATVLLVQTKMRLSRSSLVKGVTQGLNGVHYAIHTPAAGADGLRSVSKTFWALHCFITI